MLFLSSYNLKNALSLTNPFYGIELRLDLFPEIHFDCIDKFLQNASRPVMLTLRHVLHGGKFQGGEEEREAIIEKLLRLEPPFFDLEYDIRPEFLTMVLRKYSKTQFVLSYHNFVSLPKDLEKIYLSMQKFSVFDYKMAVMCRSGLEALQMLLFIKKHPKMSGICMGQHAVFARVLGPLVGNLVDFGCLGVGEETGPGQLTSAEWTDIYRYPALNRHTKIYGLIGDPVEASLGHIYHNDVFRKRNWNAVYVKIPIKKEELSEFIFLAKEMGIRGLSVTVPHKESILPFVDEIDSDARNIGAVNTLRLEDGKIWGTNTDGLGALDAIEKKGSVFGKQVVLLGAGGTARAIAYEAKKRGASVLILNRTVERAKKVASQIGCEYGNLSQIPDRYDVLVHCSPSLVTIDPEKLKPDTVVMDIVYNPRVTAFLKMALSKKCQIVYGEEMFYNQAARQTNFWQKTC